MPQPHHHPPLLLAVAMLASAAVASGAAASPPPTLGGGGAGGAAAGAAAARATDRGTRYEDSGVQLERGRMSAAAATEAARRGGGADAGKSRRRRRVESPPGAEEDGNATSRLVESIMEASSRRGGSGTGSSGRWSASPSAATSSSALFDPDLDDHDGDDDGYYYSDDSPNNRSEDDDINQNNYHSHSRYQDQDSYQDRDDDDDEMINSDDLTLLDSIFGDAFGVAGSDDEDDVDVDVVTAGKKNVPSSSSAEAAVAPSDPSSSSSSGANHRPPVKDDEIDGLFERAGRLLDGDDDGGFDGGNGGGGGYYDTEVDANEYYGDDDGRYDDNRMTTAAAGAGASRTHGRGRGDADTYQPTYQYYGDEYEQRGVDGDGDGDGSLLPSDFDDDDEEDYYYYDSYTDPTLAAMMDEYDHDDGGGEQLVPPSPPPLPGYDYEDRYYDRQEDGGGGGVRAAAAAASAADPVPPPASAEDDAPIRYEEDEYYAVPEQEGATTPIAADSVAAHSRDGPISYEEDGDQYYDYADADADAVQHKERPSPLRQDDRPIYHDEDQQYYDAVQRGKQQPGIEDVATVNGGNDEEEAVREYNYEQAMIHERDHGVVEDQEDQEVSAGASDGRDYRSAHPTNINDASYNDIDDGSVDYETHATFVNTDVSPTPISASFGIEDIIHAHRIAVAKDLGLPQPDKSSIPSFASIKMQQKLTPSHLGYSTPSDNPRGYGYGGGYGFEGGGGGADDPIARAEARKKKKERNLRRAVSSDVHRTFTTAVASVIRGDASPHVPADLFGQTLEEERSGTKLAGLGPEFDENGMYAYGRFCTEEELASFSEWSSLLQSTAGNQCGAVDVKTAKAKLYGGAQYHRCVRCFSALLLTLPLPAITEEELSLLLTASGSAGGGSHGAAGHDGPDLLRTAAILCRTKMEGLVRYALDELAGRVEYILLERCWECVKYSALVRPAAESGTGILNYGSEGRRRKGKAMTTADDDDFPHKYTDLEDTFHGVVKDAYVKFVKKSVAEAAQMGWTDAMALLRYVSWDMTVPKPRRQTRNAGRPPGQSSTVKPIRGGGGSASFIEEEELGSDQARVSSSSDAPSQPTRPAKARQHRATTVRPVKKSKRQIAREKEAAEKKAKELAEEEKVTQGLLSKVRLFRRTGKSKGGDDATSRDADLSAYYDLNELYGLDDENDEVRYNEEEGGDLVGGVLHRGVDDEDYVEADVATVGQRQPVHVGQMSSDVNEDYDDGFELSKTQSMEDDEMLNILLRAAAVAASSNQSGAASFETQTRAAMTALVKFVTDRWRRDLVSLIIGKFNSFCLLGFHSEFGGFLRQEIEQKLSELDQDESK